MRYLTKRLNKVAGLLMIVFFTKAQTQVFTASYAGLCKQVGSSKLPDAEAKRSYKVNIRYQYRQSQ
jgi:hypothetical protein